MTRENGTQILGRAEAATEAVETAIGALSQIDPSRTNRKALMEELDSLGDAGFEQAVIHRRTGLSEAIEAAMCRDCRRMHGDSCPSPEDEPCPISIADWLSMPCRHKRLIPEARQE